MMHGKTPAVDVSDSSKPERGLTTESNGLYRGERVKIKKRTVNGEESAVTYFTVAVISLTF